MVHINLKLFLCSQTKYVNTKSFRGDVPAKTAIPIKDNNEDEFVISEVQNACFKKLSLLNFSIFLY